MNSKFSEYVDNYFKDGVSVIPDFILANEMALINLEMNILVNDPNVPKVYENDNKVLRSLHNCEAHSRLFNKIVSIPRMVNLVKKIVDDDVYLQQFKINLKYAFNGDIWQWHQDFAYYYNEDQIREPRLVNAVIFLDDITEYNSPLYYIPKSHLEGLLSTVENVRFNKIVKDVGWEKNFKAEMKYKLSNEVVSELVKKYTLKSAKGSRGSLMLLHPNIVHASPPNISPFNRRMIFITYNAISNRPNYVDKNRKGVVSGVENTVITVLESDSII